MRALPLVLVKTSLLPFSPSNQHNMMLAWLKLFEVIDCAKSFLISGKYYASNLCRTSFGTAWKVPNIKTTKLSTQVLHKSTLRRIFCSTVVWGESTSTLGLFLVLRFTWAITVEVLCNVFEVQGSERLICRCLHFYII